MVRYHIFTGAPPLSKSSTQEKEDSYHWQTVVTPSPSISLLYTIPPATLEAVGRRISLFYQNTIFHDDGDPMEYEDDIANPNRQLNGEQTTIITWPPTADGNNDSRLRSKPSISYLRTPGSLSRIQSHLQTQETQDTGSYDNSDASSVVRFPNYHFSLHQLTPLSALPEKLQPSDPLYGGSRKATILVAILEVEGPDTIRVKKGVDAGKEVSILKLIIGDEEGVVYKLTGWREVAELWGGSDPDPSAPGLKRGDIALLENVLVAKDSSNPSLLSLTASPHLKSKQSICFRTLPNSPEDARFRPDLRLGYSDVVVKKVATVVAWFETMAGLR